MEQEVIRHRNAVFNRIYYSTLLMYKNCVPVSIQWIMEIGVLSMACFVLFLWGYVHFTYIVSSEDCLAGITQRPFPDNTILQVEVYSNTSEIWQEREKALQELYDNTRSRKTISARKFSSGGNGGLLNIGWIRDFCETSYIVNLTGTTFFCQLILAELFNVNEKNGGDTSMNSDQKTLTEEMDMYEDSASDCAVNSTTCRSRTFYDTVTDVSHESDSGRITEAEFFSKNYTLYDLVEFYSLHMLVLDYSILEFSQEPGYLSLTNFARSKLNISVAKVYLDPDSTTCFGGPFGRFMTKYFLGYDMMVISSFKGLLSSDRASGYVKNLLTGNQYYYKVQWMGKWRYGAGILPALFFTLVASVLLRRIHYHIFSFLTHFHHLLNQGIPMPIHTGAQIPFLIVTYATIGLVIVMSEALSDDSIFSFLMVGTVWEVDQFYSVFCKQATSKVYLPWFFFLYHFLPYAYYIRFNGQFWFIPFLFHWLLLQHAMLFFLHHCELPSLNNVHILNPAPVNLHLHLQPAALLPHHVEDHDMPQGEDESEEDQGDDESSEQEGSEQLVGTNQGLVNETLTLANDQEGHSPNPPGDKEHHLMRPQLRRTSSGALSASASVVSSQASSSQLSDEELRLARLQRFEKKIE